MRWTKAATTGLVTLAALLAVGTGFAAFTTSAFVQGQGQAGTLGPLVWGPSPAYGGFAANDNCFADRGTTTSAGDTLYLTAGNLAPGDICSYGDNLNNLGSLPASVSEQVTSASGGLCSVLAFGDNFFSPSVVIGGGGQTSTLSHVVPAGSYIQWAGFIHLLPGASSRDQGLSCTFEVTLTGTAGT
ncbi:MAG TPA: hypothetical protein VMH38_01860 [Thermoplasmata archaeon]|nr:hypothetical protein [Thermoplasmata archaeon]